MQNIFTELISKLIGDWSEMTTLAWQLPLKYRQNVLIDKAHYAKTRMTWVTPIRQ
jgi:hypothetical protein